MTPAVANVATISYGKEGWLVVYSDFGGSMRSFEFRIGVTCSLSVL